MRREHGARPGLLAVEHAGDASVDAAVVADGLGERAALRAEERIVTGELGVALRVGAPVFYLVVIITRTSSDGDTAAVVPAVPLQSDTQ